MSQITRIIMVAVMIGCQGGVSAWAGAGEFLIGQPEAGQSTHKQQNAQKSQYLNIEGTLKEIQGDMYVLEGGSSEKPVKVHIGGDTAFPNGQKEPGQPVQALVVASTGHALIIR